MLMASRCHQKHS